MDVRFIATTSDKISELSVVNGQLIYLSDINAAYYDMDSTRRLVSSLKIGPSLPSTSAAQENIIYGIINNDNNVDSWIWDASASTYRQLSGYVATTDAVGLVKPDGVTITVDANGKIRSHAVVDEFPATSVTFDNSESGLASTEVQSALTEIATIANQQSDWAQASTAAVDYIKNKPELSTVATSGKYADLLNKPDLGTASAKDVPVSGNASTAQVVMGDDTRLTDARNAADVYSWAKAETKPTYTASEVGAIASTSAGANNGIATLGSSGKLTASQLPLGNASTQAYYGDKGKTAYDHSQLTTGNPHNVTASDVGLGNVGNFKAVSTAANQGLSSTEKANAIANIGASTFSGSYNDLSDKPTIPQGTVTTVTTGAGLTGGPVTSSGTIKANLKSETAATYDSNNITNTSSREYAVTPDKSGYLAVNVPWSNTYTSAYCDTAAATQAKTASCTSYTLAANSYLHITIANANSYNGAITLNVNGKGAKPIYINGAASSTSNKTLPAGSYIVYYDGTNYYFRTDGKLTVKGLISASGSTAQYFKGDGTLSSPTRSIYWGTCAASASTVQNKTVSVSADQGFVLEKGAAITVKFDADNTFNATTAAPVALNVAGSGNKTIYYGNSGTATGTNTTAFGRKNYINQYIYDGTYWVWQGSSADNNSTYSPASLGFGYGTCDTAASTAAKVATLSSYSLVTGGFVAIKFTNAVPARATLNINSKGAKNIYYKGAAITAGIINAGDTALFVYSNQYHLISVDSLIGTALITE